jgi:hypothetical protein
VTFAWIFFRTDDGIGSALGYIKQIGVSIIEHPGQFLMLPPGKTALVYIIALLLGDWHMRRNERVLKSNKKLLELFISLITLIYFINTILMKSNASFIYFQF